MADTGKFIVIEGPDGVGKTTLVTGLRDSLRPVRAVRCLREPGGTELSELIREIVKGQRPVGAPLDPRAEALLFAAARAQLTGEVLRPALARGEWVLLDRWIDSSKVYQGTVRGLGVDAVAGLSQFAVDGLAPDRVLVLSVDERTARARMAGRDGADGADRLERLDQAAIRESYRSLTQTADRRYRTVDASGSPRQVLDAALAALADLL